MTPPRNPLRPTRTGFLSWKGSDNSVAKQEPTLVDDFPVAQRQPPKLSANSARPAASTPWAAWVSGLAVLLGLVGIGGWLFVVGWRQTPLASQSTPSVLPTPQSSPAPSLSNTPALPTPRTLLGHRPFIEAPRDSLRSIGLGRDGRDMLMRAAAAERFKGMQAAAQAEGVRLVPISSFRSLEDQKRLFFELARSRDQRPQERAKVSAPPGYSEHHTGYALDLGDGANAAADLSESFDQTAAYRWLQTNAARYSFELSFPRDNPQGVSYEPWHWRFVGDSDSLQTFY